MNDYPTDSLVYAVTPARGLIIHLYQHGYAPSQKPRPLRDVSALCGHGIWANGKPLMPRHFIALDDAIKWTSLDPSPFDPRPSWSWCRPCLGHLVTLTDQTIAVLERAA
jgi:hypothetical protein